MHALIIEDDPNIADLIAVHLRDAFTKVTQCDNGWHGLDEASSGRYDFLVLDINLPGLNGVEICRQLRLRKCTIPILMLTARSEEEDKVIGLEIGADDYITKPFSPAEMMARIKSILRRTKRQNQQMEQLGVRIERGPLVLDLESMTAQKGMQKMELTVKELELLQFFMQNPGRVFSRQEILDAVWGEQFEGLEHTVNSNINRLRTKIEANAEKPEFILTVWGIGYKFSETWT